MDLLFFAGPIVITEAMQHINWRGRDVRIVPVPGSGSDYFSALAEQLRDAHGRILPGLIERYAPGVSSVDKIALAAFSAGHGLLNKIADQDADRAAISAMILSDATFSGLADPAKPGYVKFGVEAARGHKLFISTTTHISPGTYLTGRDSWLLVWNEVERRTSAMVQRESPSPPVPLPSGGWWQLGSSLYWGDYTAPNSPPNTGNDFTHAEHDYLAAQVWQAYLSPWLASSWPWGLVAAGVGVGLLAATAVR